MNEIFQEIVRQINKAKTIALYCHISPDGDTLCSALALYSVLKGMGKDVVIFDEAVIPVKYGFLKNIEVVTFPDKITRELAIAIDCSDLDRLGQTIKSFLSAKKQIAIDHHKTHEKFADVTLVDPNAAATAELIFKLIKHMRALDDGIAELLFAAIVSDSGCFSYSNTTVETHKIACELLSYKFDSASVIFNIQRSISKNIFDLKNRVLAKCRFFEDNQIAVMVFTKEDFDATSTDSSDTDGIVTSAINIDTVKVAFAISEVGDKNFKISIRTKDGIDASDCAREFGGGGHKNAAGCRANGYLEDVIDRLHKIGRDRM